MSDKYRTTPFYNGVSTFKVAFPDLADALIEWRERHGPEDTKLGDLRKTGFRRGNFTQGVLSCSNPTCREGGYEVDRLIAAMLREGEAEREGMLLCSGREMSEESRRGPFRCTHRIDYRVTLTVRAATPEPEPQKRSRNRRGRQRPRRTTAA